MTQQLVGAPASGPVRVLIAHNRYQQRGGEDTVVEEESRLLQSHGHPVEHYFRSNDDIDTMPRVSAAMQTVWSYRTVGEIDSLIDRFRPHVLHVHNTFPLVSPSIYGAAAKRGVAVVQTLHNFRLICPQALMLRDGRPCEDCVGRLPLPGVIHGCYRGSRAQTAVLVAMLGVHRALGTWRNHVSRFIALNAFCRDRFIAGGIPAERIAIKPNSVDLPEPDDLPREGFLFVGRLSEEKGIRVLVDAARRVPGIQIDVAGSGPEDATLQQSANIRAHGPLAATRVYDRMRRTTAVVLPSIWYENFPRTLVEAFACAAPVIASRLGAMASLVDDGETGLLFTPGDGQDLARVLAWAAANPSEMSRMGRAARRHYEAHLSATANYEALVRIYQDAIGSAGRA